MGKSLQLTIKRPNGKTYEIPITPIFTNVTFTRDTGNPFGKNDITFYEDVSQVWMLLELPISFTENFSEKWIVNNIEVNAEMRAESVGSYYNRFARIFISGVLDLRIQAPFDVDDSYPGTELSSLVRAGTQFCYDYNTKKYVIINGVQALNILNVSSSGYINLFKIAYYPDYFKHGYELIENATPIIGLAYCNPSQIRTKQDLIQQAGINNPNANNNMLNRFIQWLNQQANVDPIPEPATYPNQNPDGDDDNSGQTPSDPPIPGDGDTSSDPIPNPPAKPTFNVTNTGFVVVYNPSVTEIRQLAYFMWSGDFTDLIKKMFASPFEAIISLKMLFCPITAGSSQTVWLGNVETDVTMAKVTDQFTDVDLGTININEFFGSFADYAPFTKIQIYLPFIGFKDLNVDEVMNSQLHLRYRIDVYTGACIAYLTVTKTIKSTNLNSILYQFDGNCAMEIPFTSNDNSRYVAAIMNSVASSALSLANTSGYTMPIAGKGFNQKAIPSTFELGSLAPVANGMLDIMSAKPNVQRAGSLSGAVSAMALKQPYLIIHRPIAQMPADYQKYLGIPLNLTRQLANVTGYTIVSQVFMSSELATDREIAMITEVLKNGVIL